MVTTVLHLVGSPTSEFHAELSRVYATDCLAATADPQRYAAHIAYVTPGGQWRFPGELSPQSLAAAPPMPLVRALTHLGELGVQVMVPQMFCLAGMTAYRSLFEVWGVPFVGNRPAVMAVGADKAMTRAVVAAAGVAVPEGEVIRPGEQPSMEPPVVIKPVDADNSWGLTLARSRKDYASALRCAWEHADAALVERYVELGREVRCGVLERDGDLLPLPLEEYAVNTADTPVRTRSDKLGRGSDGRLKLMAKDGTRAWIVDPVPADTPHDPVTEAVWAAAQQSFRALGCRDHGLFDFRIDPHGTPWFLEAGLYCSFAPSSVIVAMADAAGCELTDLFAQQITHALTRTPRPIPHTGAF